MKVAMPRIFFAAALGTAILRPAFSAEPPRELRTGLAQHAFDHVGNVGNLGDLAAACGETVIYCNGAGAGYLGLPGDDVLAARRRQSLAYLKDARKHGVRLAIGYVCATSIVNLRSFATNWPPEFRAQFKTPPGQWLQMDKDGHALPSWYGAPYEPACMNNPDWRTYERFMVRQQLEAGCDGIFFDNPTVHPQGCYCPFCMEKFDAFLAGQPGAEHPGDHTVAGLRRWAATHPVEFLDFRSTIASDFLRDMRQYARTIKPKALLTCNNSLNAPDALFSQCRADGYDIDRLSQVEDYVLVEDMVSQARRTTDGRIFEYGPTYELLHAINHGKPIVACTVPDADYHTPANLARLSMAEAAAHDATWMLWPDWPENLRASMASNIFPEADFLRRNEKLLNQSKPRWDVLVYLPYRNWLKTEHCLAVNLTAALARANIQFGVGTEDDINNWDSTSRMPRTRLLLVESASVLDTNGFGCRNFVGSGGKILSAAKSGWMDELRKEMTEPSVIVHGPSTVRAVVRDQRGRTIVHLYNLDILRRSSFVDELHPARQIHLRVSVPFAKARTVRALTADAGSTRGLLDFTVQPDDHGSAVSLDYPQLAVSTLLVIEP